MKGFVKKLTAVILAVMMLVTAIAPTALAALVDNTPDQNDKILQELTGFWGNDKTAQEAMELLRENGLIDEDGNVLSDWSKEIFIHDGEEPRSTDVEELTALLEDETVSRDTVITVDGTEITLGGFETILEIQREIARIRETYLQDEVTLNQEQAASLYSLYEQLSEEGIALYNTSGADGLVFPSGINHNARVSVTSNGSGSFTARLTGAAAGQVVTFDWRAASGSQTASGSGSITLTASQPQKDFSVTLPTMPTDGDDHVRSTADLAYYVQLDNLTNALFPNGKHAMSVKDTTQKTVSTLLGSFEVTGTGTVDKTQMEGLGIYDYTYKPFTVTFNENQKQSIQWGLVNKVAIEQNTYPSNNGTHEGYYTLGDTEKALSRENINSLYNSLNNSNNKDATFTFYYIEAALCINGEQKARQDFGHKGADVREIHSAEELYQSIPAETTNTGPYDLSPSDADQTFTLIGKRTENPDGQTTTLSYLTGSGFGWGRVSTESPIDAFPTTAKFIDDKAPAFLSASAPEGSYYAGQVVPVTVTFSEPVNAANAAVKFNGQTYSAAEGTGYSNRLTFPYTVPETGNAFLKFKSISGIQDLSGMTNSYTAPASGYEILSAGSIKNGSLLSAVDSAPTANAGQVTYTPATADKPEKTTATVTVTLDMPEDTNLRNLIGGSYSVDGGFASSVLAGSIDGGETLIPLMLDNGDSPTKLTATLEIDATTLMTQQDFVMEFYTIDADTHESTGLLFGRYAAFSVNPPVPLKAEHLAIETPEGWPTGPIFASDPPEPAALTLIAQVNVPAGTTWTQTRWVSSNERIATIDASGRVYPLSAGTVTFWLEAVNGNLADYAGQRSQGVSLTVQQGVQPYLRIPESEMTIRSGDLLTLRWASNLVQKNRDYGGPDTKTTFTLTVTGPDGRQVGQPYTVTYDPATPEGTISMGDGTSMPMWTKAEGGALTPNQSFSIAGLTDTDAAGYTLTLSARAGENVPGAKEFTAETKVKVISKPVSVRLNRPGNLFQTNTGTLDISYTLANYDSKNAASFELVVTNNATGEKVYETTKTGDKGGSFPIDLANAEIQDDFRTIYDVSVKAKNVAENDWSRDSFTLYIYDKNCLDILVQPVTKNGKATVDVDGDSVTMSNEDWIASLTQEQILALNRDIDLQAAISINYSEHAWGEASDRIKWASKNSKTAAVNYPQGAYYENIESLPYTSFAPATQFLLSGKNNGATVVEAIHALAGDSLSSEVEVTVETLKNKLYLFQFYPVGEATLTYTNGDGTLVTGHKTDANGRAAIYEASGIASDIYVEADIGGVKYLGTVYKSTLVSQEKDAVSLELYPLNSLNLRKAASLPVYLKKPDGTNFDGAVIVRAGVYRNGEYCGDAKYKTSAGGDAASISGSDEHAVQFTDGKATFYYDLTQFNTDNGAKPVTAADDIQFVLELQADGYYPVLFTANGTANEDDAIRLSERIVNLETVPADQKNQPFVAKQTVCFSGKESGAAVDLRNQTGKTGPSADYPDLLLSTTVFWWGQANDQSSRTIQYVDGAGIVLTGQEQAAGSYYPFCSMPVSHSTVHLNKAQMDHLSMGDRTIRTVTLNYLDRDGTAVKKETMRWQMMNALNMPKAGESGDLMDSMDALRDIMQTEGGMSNVGSDFLVMGLKLATSAKIESDFLTLRLAPTQDPTVFRGLVYVGLGTDGEGVSGAGGYEGNLLDTMDPDDSSYELNYMPGLGDVKDMISSGLSSYGQTQKRMLTSAKNLLKNNIKQGGLTSVVDEGFGGEFSLSGWFETEVFYDFNAKAWKMQLVTGGLKAAGGFGYEWSSNFQVGPVPMFLELGVGMSAAVDFNAAVNNVEKVNDYLTQLEISAYLNAFGGFGFDYAVVALKLGIFGELSLTAQLRWLNAANTSSAQFGHKVTLAGEVGVKAEVTVLFISYSTVLWSKGFEADLGTSKNWKSIEDYWKEVGAGKSGAGEIIVPKGARMVAYDAATGTALLSAEQEAVLADRDYLSQYSRSYDSSGPSLSSGSSRVRRLASRTGSQIVKTLENSYSLASPALSDDGGWLFYLDDMENPSDATVVRVKAAQRSNTGTGYDTENSVTLSNDGFGDSGLKAAGSGNSAVAVWSRVTERPAITEPGQAITPDVQAGMLNSSDIMVAVRGGSGWTVENLTKDNGVADLSPVVAVNDQQILVAWRQVASTNATDLTNFDAKDYIYYTVSEDGGKNWTESAPLYNGTSGSVKGLEAAMLDSGEAAVVFTLQNGEPSNGAYHQEIAYAVVGKKDGGSYEVSRYVQMTDDTNLDENPQVAAVKLNDTADAFILGWHCLSGEGSDIRLAAVDSRGSRITGFVDSLGSMMQNTDVTVSPNFQFSKNAEKLEDLSILWAETDTDGGDKGDEPSHDFLSALRFRVEDGKISVTSAQRLVEMEEYTAIDSFNAYVGDDGNLYAAMQGTYYDYDNLESIQVGGTTVQVASDKTSIYTTAGAYTDTLRIDSVIPDYANIRKGTDLPVQFSVTNLGTQPLTKVEVAIDGETTTFQEAADSAFVAIAPGDTRVLTVFYPVPSTGAIPNPKYTVTGTFESGGKYAPGKETLTLNIPDLGIADSGILLDAVDGDRILQFNLYNLSDAKLAGSSRTVKFSLYSDAACTNEIDPKYLTLVKSGPGRSGNALLTVSGDDLAAIDEGSYTLQYKFDLQEYINDTHEFADGAGEVRDGGVALYAKAWVELPDPDGGEMLEYNSSNNVTDIHFESLLKQADGAPTTVTRMLDNSGAGSKVTVTLQNNSMNQKTTGNVIFTLLDEDGNVLEQKQSYDSGAQNNGLITLDVEERKTLSEVAFSKRGADVQVLYTDAVLGNNRNTNIASLSLNGIPLSYDEAAKTWRNTGAYTASGSALLSIVLEDPRATVAVNDKPNSRSMLLPLEEGDMRVAITVTAADGTTETYFLELSALVSATGVTLNKTSLNLTAGASETLTATVLPADASNRAVTWSSDNPAAATVVNGTITAVGPGTATITVTTVDGGHTASCTVTVKSSGGGSGGGGGGISYYQVKTEQPEHGTLKASPTSIYAGGTVTITATPEDGYKLEKLTVTDSQAKAVDVTEKAGKFTFKMPGRSVTVQAEFVPVSSGSPKPDETPRPSPSSKPWENPFPDVSDTEWYAKAVEYVCINGLMSGYANGKFGPNDNLSRGQFAQIIYNRESRPTPGGSKFSDVKTGQWYANAVNWAAAEGIVAGYGSGLFGPNDPITREQLAVMLWRYAGSPAPEKTDLDYQDKNRISSYAHKALCWAAELGIISGKPGKILDPKGKATRAEAAQMLKRYFEKTEETA